jgi:deoxyribonuclease-2
VDETGAVVDWFVALKVNNGYEYWQATEKAPTLVKSKTTLEDTKNGLISLTMEQSYDTAYTSLYWNDESPDGSSHSTFGHTKGVITYDTNGGYWLIDSIPKYPDTSTGQYIGIPSSGVTYGQSFMCLNLDVATIDQVAEMLQYYRPHVFSSRQIQSSVSLTPHIPLVIAGTAIKSPGNYWMPFSTKGGLQFNGFGTNDAYNKDVYYGIGQFYGLDMMAETWMNGANPLYSYCTPQYTQNILNVRNVQFGTDAWKETEDHSKWAIATSGDIVCFGGKNRMVSQTTRQGGVVCFKQATLWASLNAGIQATAPCGEKAPSNSTVSQF